MIEPNSVDFEFLSEDPFAGEAEFLSDPLGRQIPDGNPEDDTVHVQLLEPDLDHPGGHLSGDPRACLVGPNPVANFAAAKTPGDEPDGHVPDVATRIVTASNRKIKRPLLAEGPDGLAGETSGVDSPIGGTRPREPPGEFRDRGGNGLIKRLDVPFLEGA